MSGFFPDLTPNAVDDANSLSGMSGNPYEAQIRYWTEAAFEEAKREADNTPELRDMDTVIDYLAGLQWKGPQPAHRAKPVSNRTLSLFWETVGLLTDIRPIFEVHATSKDRDDQKTQDILNRLVKAWAIDNNFDMKLAFVVMFSMLTAGWAKLAWDPFANNGQGDLAMTALPANRVLRLGDGQDVQDDECLIYNTVVTLAWLRRKYPVTGALVQPDISYSKFDVTTQGPAHISPQLFMNLSVGMKRKIGTAPDMTLSVYPKVQYREFWMKDDSRNESNKVMTMGRKGTNWCYDVKPGEMLYPRGRIIAMANRVILDDQPNPYWHGRFPFAQLRLQAVPWQSTGMSVMKPIMSNQDIMNQILGGILNMTKLAISPPLLAPKNAFTPEQWKNLDMSRPNEKAQYSANAPFKPEFRKAPEIPAYVLQLHNIVDREMDRFSGAAAIGNALQKKQVPSGDSLDQITQSKNTPIRQMGRNIEGFIGELGQLFIPNLLQFYTAPMRLELLGSNGLLPVDYDANPGSLIPQKHALSPEAYARKFKFKIERGSLLSVQRVERANWAVKLFAMKAMSLQQLYRSLDLNIDVDKMMKEMLEEAKAVAEVAPPKKGKK